MIYLDDVIKESIKEHNPTGQKFLIIRTEY